MARSRTFIDAKSSLTDVEDKPKRLQMGFEMFHALMNDVCS